MPKAQASRRAGWGLIIVIAVVVIIYLVSGTGDNEWESALKQGGDFSSEQWDSAVCATILNYINEGYVDAWYSQQDDEIRVSKRPAPESWTHAVPILGTHLRHCRG